jgi:hypothetical protein
VGRRTGLDVLGTKEVSYRDSILGPSSPQCNRNTDYVTRTFTRDRERRNIVLLFRLCSLFQDVFKNSDHTAPNALVVV